jgi:membrane protease YdiL (CAAX protease family)
MLLVAIILAVAVVGIVAAFVAGDTAAPSLRFFARDSKRIAWQLGIPCLLVLVRREWIVAFGLSPQRLPMGLRAVALYGPILFFVVLALSYLHGRYRIYDPLSLPVTLTNCAYYLLFNALAEELFFRGMLQTALVRLLRSRTVGLVLASVVFGLYHIPMFGWSVGDTVMPAVGGLVFGLAFLRTQSIVTAWFLHGFADLALLNDTVGTYLLKWVFC